MGVDMYSEWRAVRVQNSVSKSDRSNHTLAIRSDGPLLVYMEGHPFWKHLRSSTKQGSYWWFCQLRATLRSTKIDIVGYCAKWAYY